ncbi:hypothetical protein N0V90_013254 [Kalmusia sp. IMI 367209]|nr:hypothetical protein N0V90_013254 [Kalmusia sp. IMI 367209]
MQLRTIPFVEVEADITATAHIDRDSSNSATRTPRFNACLHELEEIAATIPNTSKFTHSSPPWTAYGYTLWLPVIVKSQGLQDSHVFQIPLFVFEDLMRCHSSWINTGKISQQLLDDAAEAWESCKSGKVLQNLFNGTNEWFVRLDQMSPKDSPLVTGAVRSIQDLIKKLASSMRVYGSLHREMEEATKQGRRMNMLGVLNPWNANMDASYEFRVFVPPPAARQVEDECLNDLKIAAISQYRWHEPFKGLGGMTIQQTADKVYDGARAILQELIEHANQSLDQGIQALLIKHGLTFDVTLHQGNDVQLIEINPFGAMSGCGACLFNWIIDAHAMYGLEDEVVMLITE